MDIKQVQDLVNREEWAVSPAIKQRIMENKMTMRDVSFLEQSIMSGRLLEIRMDMELLVPTFQEASMRMIELEQQGETEVDLEYAKKLINDTTDYFMRLSELVSDYGLTGVEVVSEEAKGLDDHEH